MYGYYFSNFGRHPVPDDLCKDSATRHRLWRRFLNIFTIYGHGGHLGQQTVTILAIFRSSNLRRLHMKFEQNWLSSFRGEVVWKCLMDGRTKSDHYGSLRWANNYNQGTPKIKNEAFKSVMEADSICIKVLSYKVKVDGEYKSYFVTTVTNAYWVTESLQMLCNIFPILSLQLMKRSSFKQFSILKNIWARQKMERDH